MISSQVYYITGASKGIGKQLAKSILANGDKVAATSRDKKQLTEIFGENSQNFLALQVDLANESSVKQSVEEAVKHFGTLDVIINNAGFGYIGSIEESTDEQARENFDINFFGTLNVIRQVLPTLRQKRSGLIINVTSVCSVYGFPGCGIYSATKAAVDLLTESLQQELKPFNIKALTINPGYFRTEFLGQTTKPVNSISDYAPLHAWQAKHDAEMHQKQRGDPEKLANIVSEIVKRHGQGIEIPTHIFIGPDSNELSLVKAKQTIKDIEDWSSITTNTDYDDFKKQ